MGVLFTACGNMSAPPAYGAPYEMQPMGMTQPIAGQPIQTQPGQPMPGFGQAQNGAQPEIAMGPGGTAVCWMPRPLARNSGVTPGLEYLDVLDTTILKQKIDLMEAMTG